MNFADICLYRADNGDNPIVDDATTGRVIETGLLAIDRVLLLAPATPRALAIQGGLLVLQSRRANGEKRKLLERAREAISQALRANANLEHGCERWAKEVEKQLTAL